MLDDAHDSFFNARVKMSNLIKFLTEQNVDLKNYIPGHGLIAGVAISRYIEYNFYYGEIYDAILKYVEERLKQNSEKGNK